MICSPESASSHVRYSSDERTSLPSCWYGWQGAGHDSLRSYAAECGNLMPSGVEDLARRMLVGCNSDTRGVYDNYLELLLISAALYDAVTATPLE